MDKKRDLNAIIGFFLIGIILVWFVFTSNPEEPVDTPAQTEQTETAQPAAKAPAKPVLPVVPDTTFTPSTETVTLENEKVKLSFNPQGAQLVLAEVKGYQTFDSLPLNLIQENQLLELVWEEDGKSAGSSSLSYKGEVSRTDEGQQVRFVTRAAGNRELVVTYLLPKDRYQVKMQVDASRWTNGGEREIRWEMLAKQQELNVKNERINTELYFYSEEEDDYDYLSGTEDSEEASNLRWIAYKQQFFSGILGIEGGIPQARMAVKDMEDGRTIKAFASSFKLPGEDAVYDLTLYLGPNKFEILKAYDQGYEKLIPLGWGIFGWISRGVVIPIFNWLEDYGINYGLIILIMAVIIKLVLFPLTYRSYLSMAKMRVLRPEIEELQEKNKGKDAMKAQQATLELYRKAGVSPLGGCVPMLLQFPILIAMFRFFPSSIELRQQGFLWAHDLSTYDSIFVLPFEIPFYGSHVSLFTLLMTVSTLLYTYFNNQITGSSAQMKQMKWMMYLMPIVFLGVFNNYASGLSYYYFVANMLTFGQQALIRAFVDDDAIHAKIQENKQRPVKGNRLQRRLEEVTKQQQRRK